MGLALGILTLPRSAGFNLLYRRFPIGQANKSFGRADFRISMLSGSGFPRRR
jgi:hypothetical protein